MLIIPFDRKIDWKHAPVVTLLLILINTLIYFGWQSGDDQRMEDALTYYQESGLAKMERTAYKEYLTKRDKKLPEIYQQEEKDKKQKENAVLDAWTAWTLSDYDFSTTVKSGQLIPAGSEKYKDWQDKRAQFDQKMSQVVFWEYGLKTDVLDPVELITHMFLHGSFMHLFGNMFFLLAVGFLVERTIGSSAYLVCYLLAGLGSAAFDFTFAPDRITPGIGASGAISGIMGMYSVLFWTRRIRFFYFLFVIFGFATLPAIILLPVWIADQLYLLLSDKESHINYLAHLGGLVFGGAIAFLVRKYLPSYSLDSFEQEDKDKDIEQQLEQAVELCDALEYRKAQPILTRLHAQRPDDTRILHHLHLCSRLQPESEAYHKLTRKILSQRHFDKEANKWILDTFRDYLQRAKPGPRLDIPVVIQLASRFIETGHLKEAERLVVHLLKKAGSKEKTRDLASELGNKMMQAGEFERGRKLLNYVKKLSFQAEDT